MLTKLKFGIYAVVLGTAALASPFSMGSAQAQEIYGGVNFGNTEWDLDRGDAPDTASRTTSSTENLTEVTAGLYDRNLFTGYGGGGQTSGNVLVGAFNETRTIRDTGSHNGIDTAGEAYSLYLGRVVYDGPVKVGVEAFYTDLGDFTAARSTYNRNITQRVEGRVDTVGGTTLNLGVRTLNSSFNTVDLSPTTLVRNENGTFDRVPFVQSGSLSGSAKTWGVAARVMYDLNDNLGVFGRLGVHRWSTSRRGVAADLFVADDDGVDPVYGIGIQYRPLADGKTYTTLGYDMYHVGDDTVAKAYLGVGVTLKR